MQDHALQEISPEKHLVLIHLEAGDGNSGDMTSSMTSSKT
jgi:hypothetical protein